MIRAADPLPFQVPAEDLDEFLGLSDRQKETVNQLLGLMRIIGEAETIRSGLAHARVYNDTWSSKRLGDLYRDYRREGDWRVLAPQWSTPPSLPVAFVSYWKTLCERNQRKCKPAYRALIRQWQRWCNGDAEAAIPGYTHPPAAVASSGKPKGWSFQNLIRHRPEDIQLTAARIGRSAAVAKYRPKVLTTRAGLAVGQYVLFDDVWHDLHVNIVGQSSAMRPIEVGCIDLLSAYRSQYLVKPIREREDGTRQQLKWIETLYVAASHLQMHGYRPEGTVFIGEHGTATFPQQAVDDLARLSAGAITVETGGIQGAPAIAGDYAGRGHGNPRFKPALESFHNLLHNELAALPGQSGLDRYHSPETLHGQMQHNDRVVRALVSLARKSADPEIIRSLRTDLLEFHQFTRLLGAVYDLISDDTDHNLEGWESAGLTATEFRLSPEHPWASLEDADHEQRQLAAAFCHGRDNLTRARKLSRREAWMRGAKGLRKWGFAQVAEFLRPHCAEVRRLADDQTFTLQASHYSPDPFTFLGEAHGMNGSLALPLKRGEKYETVWNPLDPYHLHVYDASGHYLGVCAGQIRPRRDDQEAVKRSIGQARRIEAQMLAGVSFRGQQLADQRKADAEANIRLLDPTERERLESREWQTRRANQGDEDSFLDDSVASRRQADESPVASRREADEVASRRQADEADEGEALSAPVASRRQADDDSDDEIDLF